MRIHGPAAGRVIAALARHLPKLAVVTQNVDGPHERAGSSHVAHLHGCLHAPRLLRPP
ncbi:Sir2 family NAD-dependent protein deacetylase [Achromobacter agilis]|uniref:Sir2 family NAD-dependent protein deacetylase n=1 Tax=Achromobacter agilis TaxID=1353888 RepID=UPI0010133FE8|nr:Sir2 family NAD-dependent protein deacetylase [Achromobacter agilis]